MWSVSFARGLLLALVAVVLVVVPGVPAEARSTWEKDGNVITITVHAAVIGANAEGKAAFFEQAFAAHYPPSGFRVSCFTVVFELDAIASDRPIAGRHSLFIVPLDRSQPWISEAQVLSNPSQRSGRSYMSDWDDGSTVVHEITHLMGLPDEYGYYDENNNGRRDPTERTYPDPNKAPEYTWNDSSPADGTVQPNEVSLRPGERGSLMADVQYGRVLDRHALELLKKSVPEDELKCEWEGSGSIDETPLKDDHRELTRSAEFEFTFSVDPGGVVDGDITLTYDAKLTVDDLPRVNVGIASFDPEVGGEVTDPNPVRTFPLTGYLSDGFLELELATPVELRPSIEFTIRADPGVSAGLGGAPVRGSGGEEVLVIRMTPFSPFGAPAEVESGPRGPLSASTEEAGDNYRLEWKAEYKGD